MHLGEEKTSECLLFLFADCERPDDLSVKNASIHRKYSNILYEIGIKHYFCMTL